MHRDEALKKARREFQVDMLARVIADANTPPPGPFAETYRIASYADNLVGASPECNVLRPKFDSGLKWPDKNNPKPEDFCWDRGVSGGIRWDGTFHRDAARYPAGGQLFWSSYFRPGSEPGIKKGYWINFGSGWSHLHNDNPAEILTGASQKLFWEPVAGGVDPGGPASPPPAATGTWKLVIQATKFVTHEIIDVWTGTKSGGNDPIGTYTRQSGLDPLATLAVEAA